jgi:hypothetical protein
MIPLRRRHIATVVAVAFCLAASAGLVTAQEAAKKAEALPEARAIIDKYIDAVGGEKAIKKIKSMEMTGELKIPAAGINGSLKIQAMAPNKMLVTSEIPGMGMIREGYDGTIAWSVDPNMGPRVKDGEELAQAEFQSDFYGTLHDDSRFKSMETVEPRR